MVQFAASSASHEDRWPLFGEGTAALGEVCAGQAGAGPLVAATNITLRGIAERSGDCVFGRDDGQRRIGGNASGKSRRERLEFDERHYLIDQAEAQRIRRGIAVGGVEDLLGAGGSDQLGEALELTVEITYPQARCGYAK